MRALVTGGAGFIGHHLVRHLLLADWEVVSLDRLDVSGNYLRLAECLGDLPKTAKNRFRQSWHDLRSEINPLLSKQLGRFTHLFHLAAASHVDRSIADPLSFVLDNVVGTCNLLNYARSLSELRCFLLFSTDEVFGCAKRGVSFKEWDRYRASNPYAASKAGAEELSFSYWNTYGVPVVIAHVMNTYGIRQHPEKFIPKAIRAILSAEPLCLHTSKDGEMGTRFYVHVDDVVQGIEMLAHRGNPGDKYNLAGQSEVSNLQLASFIAECLGKPLNYSLCPNDQKRPGHDWRYELDGTRMREMGFVHRHTIEDALPGVVHWSVDHPHWLDMDQARIGRYE
jgi:dTDP-glucose 4,6-dehydratase